MCIACEDFVFGKPHRYNDREMLGFAIEDQTLHAVDRTAAP